MATDEHNVLSLKEMYITRVLKWKSEFADALINRGLLKLDELKAITSMKTNEAKTKKLFKHLAIRNKKGDLDQLIGALNDAKELQLSSLLKRELLAERGELQIDPVIDKESATIVHKEHGHQKRLSEEERKKLHALLCTRTQCSRETWEQQMNDAEERLEDELKRTEQLDLFAEYLSRQIESFLNASSRKGSGKQQLLKNSGADGTEGDPENQDRDHMRRLEENANTLINLCSRSLLGMENISNEVLRSFRILKTNPDDTSIEHAIEKILSKHQREKEKREESTQFLSRESTALVLEMKQLEKTTNKTRSENEKLMDQLENDTKATEKKIDVLEEHLLGLKERVKAARDLREDWKARCEALEKGARLTHIYRRDGDREDSVVLDGPSTTDPDEEFFKQEALQYGAVEPEQPGGAAAEPEKKEDKPKPTRKKSIKKGQKKTKASNNNRLAKYK